MIGVIALVADEHDQALRLMLVEPGKKKLSLNHRIQPGINYQPSREQPCFHHFKTEGGPRGFLFPSAEAANKFLYMLNYYIMNGSKADPPPLEALMQAQFSPLAQAVPPPPTDDSRSASPSLYRRNTEVMSQRPNRAKLLAAAQRSAPALTPAPASDARMRTTSVSRPRPPPPPPPRDTAGLGTPTSNRRHSAESAELESPRHRSATVSGRPRREPPQPPNAAPYVSPQQEQPAASPQQPQPDQPEAATEATRLRRRQHRRQRSMSDPSKMLDAAREAQRLGLVKAPDMESPNEAERRGSVGSVGSASSRPPSAGPYESNKRYVRTTQTSKARNPPPPPPPAGVADGAGVAAPELPPPPLPPPPSASDAASNGPTIAVLPSTPVSHRRSSHGQRRASDTDMPAAADMLDSALATQSATVSPSSPAPPAPPPPPPPSSLGVTRTKGRLGSQASETSSMGSQEDLLSSEDLSDSECPGTPATPGSAPIIVTQHLMASIQSFAKSSLRAPPPPRTAERDGGSGMASAIEKAILSKRWAFERDSDNEDDTGSDADSFMSDSDEADPDTISQAGWTEAAEAISASS